LKLAKTFTDTYQILKQAYGEDYLSHMQCHEWYEYFKSGRTFPKDNPKIGHPSISTDNYVEKAGAVICENRSQSFHEVSEESGIIKSLCDMILTEILAMHHVAEKLVPT
jgi:hypothetical protein